MAEADAINEKDAKQGPKTRQQLLASIEREPERTNLSTKFLSKLQKSCWVSLICTYILSYLSLSSNPKVIFSDFQYDEVRAAQIGVSQEEATYQDEHIRLSASQIARVWTPVSPSQWCIDGKLKFEQSKGKPMGLCYLKMPRAASSTLAGINHRISSSFAKRQGIQSCIRHDGPTPAFYFRNRVKGLSFLWTFVRDPSDRALSRVASGISKHSQEAHYRGSYSNNFTDAYVLNALEQSKDIQYGTISEGRGGFQVQYTMLRVLDEYMFWNESQPNVVQHHEALQQHIKATLWQYDFVGVVERFDESLVALQLLMGLDTSDILYVSSRMPLQFTRSGRRCIKNIDPQTLRSRPVKDFLQSTTWWAQNYGDWLLHKAASISLDRTIKEIGVHYFAQAYSDFQEMRNEVMQKCQPIFPCSHSGTDQSKESRASCYEEDIGCGYPCIDEIASTTRAIEGNGSPEDGNGAKENTNEDTTMANVELDTGNDPKYGGTESKISIYQGVQ